MVLCGMALQIQHFKVQSPKVKVKKAKVKGQGQRSEKETLTCFSETIEATVTKFGTKVLCQDALQMITLMMTLTEGQGHKGQGQRSEKETLACFAETIEATVTKFGTKVLGDNALHNMNIYIL